MQLLAVVAMVVGALLGYAYAGVQQGFAVVFRVVWLSRLPPLVMWPAFLGFMWYVAVFAGNWWFYGMSWSLFGLLLGFGAYAGVAFFIGSRLSGWWLYAPGYGVLRSRLNWWPVKRVLRDGQPLFMVRWWPGPSGKAVPSALLLVAAQVMCWSMMVAAIVVEHEGLVMPSVQVVKAAMVLK